MEKRVVTIVDGSQAGVDITFWDDVAKQVTYKTGDIIALKSVRVTEYNGISLTFDRGTS
jgi:hypothetical protein